MTSTPSVDVYLGQQYWVTRGEEKHLRDGRGQGTGQMQQVPPLVGVVQFVEQRWGALLVTKKDFNQSICTLNKTKVLGHKIKTR